MVGIGVGLGVGVGVGLCVGIGVGELVGGTVIGGSIGAVELKETSFMLYSEFAPRLNLSYAQSEYADCSLAMPFTAPPSV